MHWARRSSFITSFLEHVWRPTFAAGSYLKTRPNQAPPHQKMQACPDFGKFSSRSKRRPDPKLIDSHWPKQTLGPSPHDLGPSCHKAIHHTPTLLACLGPCLYEYDPFSLFSSSCFNILIFFLGKGLVSGRHKLPSFPSLTEYQTPPLRFLHGDIGFSWQAGLQTTQRNVYSSAAPEEPGGWAPQPREILLSSQKHFHGDWGACWIRGG